MALVIAQPKAQVAAAGILRSLDTTLKAQHVPAIHGMFVHTLSISSGSYAATGAATTAAAG
ncbi:hypothetical protein BN000_03353 [Mycobacterium europaeum]|uniref:Uncharacterized protein n=1 Tax=Mycobacterium europaeum TaxID=761804 RepID=A0A0U1DHR0_9MYCO|nr:hypothetical protein [Mycobacterium europaeum]ORV63683.1 hypothetical protein AWC03_04755 [Mycobacterium europaeum]CQD15962.1 hypothetical protein BN000_03353 [Mycobacterium europaeum]